MVAPPLQLLKDFCLNFEPFRFCPTVALQHRERIVDRAKWLIRLDGVVNARLHRSSAVFRTTRRKARCESIGSRPTE